MRHYEIMFIVNPNSTEEEVDKLISQMEGVVKSYQGEVVGVEKMGKRKLAYRIGKSEEGIYLLFKINASGECVKEFERRLRVFDFVIRYISVRVDEDLKRMEKLLQISFSELREAVGLRPPQKDKAKRKRRAVPAAAVPAEPVQREIPVAVAAPPVEVRRNPEPAPSLRAENVLTEVVVA